MSAVFSVRNVVGLLALSAVLFVGGCNRFGGKYTASKEGSTTTIDFKSSDKADVSTMGKTMECAYTKDGDKITLQPPAGEKGPAMVFTLESDGSLTSPEFGGVKFTKK